MIGTPNHATTPRPPAAIRNAAASAAAIATSIVTRRRCARAGLDRRRMRASWLVDELIDRSVVERLPAGYENHLIFS